MKSGLFYNLALLNIVVYFSYLETEFSRNGQDCGRLSFEIVSSMDCKLLRGLLLFMVNVKIRQFRWEGERWKKIGLHFLH